MNTGTRNNKNKIRNRARVALFGLSICLLSLGLSSAHANDKWVSVWASAQQGVNSNGGEYERVFNNQTLRQIAKITLGGSTVRVRLSNVLGSQPVTINSSSVAKRTNGHNVAGDTFRRLTFNGSDSVTIAAGTYAVSDPVSLEVQAFDDLAISTFFAGYTVVGTQHNVALTSNYLSGYGDQTLTSDMPIGNVNESSYLLSGVDVLAGNDTTVIAAFGDSITDGSGSSANSFSDYPNLLARRLSQNSVNSSVLNLGIAGNRVLLNDIGPSMLSRFDRDVLSRAGVTHVVLLAGINDIGQANWNGSQPQGVMAEKVINGYRELIDRARNQGLKIIGSTLTPFHNSGYFTDAAAVERESVNHWIRTSGAFDGVIDFDRALQDPNNPQTMQPAYNSGDNLHPSNAGYQAMATSVDLSLFNTAGNSSTIESTAAIENNPVTESTFNVGGVTATRYDSTQGEIFWSPEEFSLFNVYRDQVLVTPMPTDGRSFYQDNLVSGRDYQYEVIGVDSSGNESKSIGSATIISDQIPSVSGQRYDANRGEIFWNRSGFEVFQVRRDSVLMTPDNSTGTSFYESDLEPGKNYIYEVYGLNANSDVQLIGKVQMVSSVGEAQFIQ